MSTIAINPSQQRLLDAINRRLDELDTAATPAVAGILTAADQLPPADRLYVKRRLQAIGAPDTAWVAYTSRSQARVPSTAHTTMVRTIPAHTTAIATRPRFIPSPTPRFSRSWKGAMVSTLDELR